MLRSLLILILVTMAGNAWAHTVPVIVIEAEFTRERHVTLKVNLDPRLFLTSQPTTLPPIPGSWWFEQDDVAHEATRRQAKEYVNRTLSFTVGDSSLQGAWTVEPIDSASAFPLGQSSAEAHLLAVHQGPLPTTPGDFKVSIAKDCAVAVILLCSNVGDVERRPQSLFPGESSRGFILPPLAPPPTGVPILPSAGTTAPDWLRAIGTALGDIYLSLDHLIVAALLGFAMHRQFWTTAGMIVAFHLMESIAALLVLAGWLPPAPLWIRVACWAAMIAAVLHVLWFKSGPRNVLLTLAIAGLCHGLDTDHLLPAALSPSLPNLGRFPLSQTATLLLVELCALAAGCWTGLKYHAQLRRRLPHQLAGADSG